MNLETLRLGGEHKKIGFENCRKSRERVRSVDKKRIRGSEKVIQWRKEQRQSDKKKDKKGERARRPLEKRPEMK